MSTIEKLRLNLKHTKGIPALESTVSEILSVLYDDKYDTRKLVELITRDVSLTQKILKLVNSAMYAPFAKNVASVSDALRVLGTKALIHLTLGALLITKVELADDEELAKTLLAAELAKCVTSDNVQENAAIAALLYNLGKLIATKYIPEDVRKVELLTIEIGDSTKAELEVLGVSYQDIGVAIAKDWKLPVSIIGVLDGTGDTGLISLAKFSNVASSLIHEGRSQEVATVATELGFSQETMSKLDVFVKEKEKSVVIKPRHEALSVRTESVTKPVILSEPVLTPEEGLNLLLGQIQAKDYSSIAELSSVVFKTLVKLMSAVHCLYFQQKTYYTYVASCGIGPDLQRISKSFVMETKVPNVIHNAISNRIDLLIADISRLSPKSVPIYFKEVLPETKRFIALPVIKDETVKGLIYVDWNEPAVFDPKQIELLKSIRDMFIKYAA